MSSPEDLDPLDRRLREILDAEPGVADRIARRALAAPAPRQNWRPAVLPLAGAVLLLALLLLPISSNKVAEPRGAAAISITNVGGVIAVQEASGSTTIVRVGESTAAPSGGQIFIAMGEQK